jgi:hypothetical protein
VSGRLAASAMALVVVGFAGYGAGVGAAAFVLLAGVVALGVAVVWS